MECEILASLFLSSRLINIHYFDLLTAGMVAAEADMLKLPFQDQSFDVVIEKGAMVGPLTFLLWEIFLT